MANDRKLLTILTEKNGVVTCFARNDKMNSAKFSAAACNLSYSQFTFYKSRSGYNLDDVTSLHMFFGLTGDMVKLFLVYYLDDLMKYIVMEEEESPEYLRLMLNTLYVLSESDKPVLLIKAVFELRVMAEAGYMPDVVACKGCGAYEAEDVYFDLDRSCIWCPDCYSGGNAVKIGRGTLFGLRTALFADPKRIFSFTLSKEGIAQLATLAEKYIIIMTEKEFDSLENFKMINEPDKEMENG